MANAKGYVNIMVDGKPMGLHRHLMQEKLGRKLSRNEVVHHIDNNPSNNDISNLTVMTLSEHSRHHSLGRKPSAEQISRQRVSLCSSNTGRKLSPQQVLDIREFLNAKVGVTLLAKMYSVSRRTIDKIRENKRYYWVS